MGAWEKGGLEAKIINEVKGTGECWCSGHNGKLVIVIHTELMEEIRYLKTLSADLPQFG